MEWVTVPFSLHYSDDNEKNAFNNSRNNKLWIKKHYKLNRA